MRAWSDQPLRVGSSAGLGPTWQPLGKEQRTSFITKFLIQAKCLGVERPHIEPHFSAPATEDPVLSLPHEFTTDTLTAFILSNPDATDSTKSHWLKQRVRFIDDADINEPHDGPKVLSNKGG